MQKTGRREILRMALVALAAPALRAEAADPLRLTRTEREAIQWGETVSGLQAGLRLVHPKAGYAAGERIELAAYLRNRTARPVRLIYYHSFTAKPPTVLGPDGRELRVDPVIDLAAVQTVTLVTLPAGETLVVDHPGLWLTTERPGGGQFPNIEDPKPGRYRIAQSISFKANPQDRFAVRTFPITLFGAADRPHRAEGAFVPTSEGETDRSVVTGTVEVMVKGGNRVR